MAEQKIQTVLAFKDEFTRKFSTAMGKAQQATDKTIKKLNETKVNLGGLKTAFVGLAGAAGLGLVAKKFFDVGQETESLTLQFETLLGSTDAATARMKELSKFAATTPFQLTEIAKASKVLQTLGGSALATGEGLRLVGDAAAISGENFQDLAVHVGRAYSGLQANRPIGESSARLQELGLISGETRNRIEQLQQQARGQEAWEVLKTALETNSGAMDKISKTAGGLVSTIRDQLDEAIRKMLSSGTWDLLKTALSNVKNQMDELLKGKFFENLGMHIFTLAQHANKAALVLRVLWNVFQNGISVIWNFGKTLFEVQKLQIAFYQAIWNGIKGDFSGALELGKKAIADFKEAFSENMNDIVTDVMQNNNDIGNAIKEGSDAQLAIERAKYKTIQELSTETKNKVIADKQEEKEKIFELDKQLTNELIALKAETDVLRAEADTLNFNSRILALETQKNAELEILDNQLQEELRLAGDNELKKDQLRKKFALKRSQVEIQATKDVKKQEKEKAESVANSLSIITGSLSETFGKNKALAIADATVNTYMAANKALASGPPPFNYIAAAAVTAAGIANVVKIKGQNFNRGGIVQGLGTRDANQPTFLTAGEGILTKDATNRIGAGGINAINDRNAQSRNITNNVTFAPTINAANNQSFGDMLRDNFTVFRDFFNEQIDKGEILV